MFFALRCFSVLCFVFVCFGFLCFVLCFGCLCFALLFFALIFAWIWGFRQGGQAGEAQGTAPGRVELGEPGLGGFLGEPGPGKHFWRQKTKRHWLVAPRAHLGTRTRAILDIQGLQRQCLEYKKNPIHPERIHKWENLKWLKNKQNRRNSIRGGLKGLQEDRTDPTNIFRRSFKNKRIARY
jgi:hypothetical protein